MPPIRSLVSKRYVYTMAIILLLSEIMPSCPYYKEKKLVYIIITALFSHQSFCYVKYTKSNMYLSCNVKLISNTEYTFVFLCNIYGLSQLLSKNTQWYTAFLALYYTY